MNSLRRRDVRRVFLLGLVIALLYAAVVPILGTGATVDVRDQLDGFDYEYWQARYLGQPLGSVIAELPAEQHVGEVTGSLILRVLLALFPMYTGFAAHYVLVVALSYVGMFFWLMDVVRPKNPLLAVLPALLFLLPARICEGFAVMGMPALFDAFYQLSRREHRAYAFTSLALYALMSSVGMTGHIVLIVMGLYTIVEWIRRRSLRAVVPMLLGLMLMVALYVAENIPLVLGALTSAGESSRAGRPIDTVAFLPTVWTTLSTNKLHAATNHFWIPFIAAAALLIALAAKLRAKRAAKLCSKRAAEPCAKRAAEPTTLLRRPLLVLLSFAAAILLAAVSTWFFDSRLMAVVKERFPITNMLDFNRFYLLDPTLWYTFLAASFAVAEAALDGVELRLPSRRRASRQTQTSAEPTEEIFSETDSSADLDAEQHKQATPQADSDASPVPSTQSADASRTKSTPPFPQQIAPSDEAHTISLPSTLREDPGEASLREAVSRRPSVPLVPLVLLVLVPVLLAFWAAARVSLGWAVLMAAVAAAVLTPQAIRRRAVAVSAVLVVFVSCLMTRAVLNENMVQNLQKLALGRQTETLTWEQYFAEEQFAQIKAVIGRPTDEYRVGSIGLSPSIASCNGMQTIDGYLVYYPAEYKAAFRKIIAAELDKKNSIRIYFDDWGNRIYLFCAELGKSWQFTKTKQRVIENLQFDMDALRALDCSYLISAVEIVNASDLGLTQIADLEDDKSAWHIRLYEVGTGDGGDA